MNNFFSALKKYLFSIFNTRAAGVYLILFAAAIGIATFIENDFGTSSAQKVIFKSWWFELLLVLFGITIVVNIFKFRMIPQKKWALLTFHASMIVILIGSGITRYFGYEGIMHIRENEASNTFLSSETYLNFEVQKGGNTYNFDEPVLFATLGNNNWEESYLIGSDLVKVEVIDFIPNPQQVLEESPDGLPTIKIVMAGGNGREEYYVSQGETRRIRNVLFNFKPETMPGAVNIDFSRDSLLITPNRSMTQMVMATQKVDTLFPGVFHPLMLRSMYSDGINSFVFGDFNKKAKVQIKSESNKVKNESMTALVMDVSINGDTQRKYVYGKKGLPGRPAVVSAGGLNLAIAYGAREISLPFAIKLYDFIMEKYPGTDNASSYASEVQLIDPRKNLEKDYRIYMNNILNYGGYRFFQSSFDKDEQGTYLSVNHDFWGTWVSYLGYILLTLGMVFSLMSKKSRFFQLSQKIQKIREKRGAFVTIFLLVLASGMLQAQKVIPAIASENVISVEHADKFSKILVQDYKGRMKPMHTMTREVLRKITRKESINNLSADQVILGMFVNPRKWHDVPMIKLGKHEDILQKLGVSGKLAAYNDFFDERGAYVLKEEVRRAYGLQPIDRGVYEKELMKIDERVNIAGMVYSGRIFKIIPVPGESNNTWVANQLGGHNQDQIQQPVADRFFGTYPQALLEAMQNNDYSYVNKMLDELGEYQRKNGGAVVPSAAKINAEITLNNMKVFGRLAGVYGVLGLGFLFFLFLSVFKPRTRLRTVYTFILWACSIGVCLSYHWTGFRWYASGRAP